MSTEEPVLTSRRDTETQQRWVKPVKPIEKKWQDPNWRDFLLKIVTI